MSFFKLHLVASQLVPWVKQSADEPDDLRSIPRTQEEKAENFTICPLKICMPRHRQIHTHTQTNTHTCMYSKEIMIQDSDVHLSVPGCYVFLVWPTELSVGKSSGLLFLAAQNLIAVYALAWLFRDFVCPLIFQDLIVLCAWHSLCLRMLISWELTEECYPLLHMCLMDL